MPKETKTNRGECGVSQAVETVALLHHCQKLVCVHQRLVDPVLAVESEFHQRIGQPSHSVATLLSLPSVAEGHFISGVPERFTIKATYRSLTADTGRA